MRYILIIGIPKYKYKVKTLLISWKICVLVNSESFNTSLPFTTLVMGTIMLQYHLKNFVITRNIMHPVGICVELRFFSLDLSLIQDHKFLFFFCFFICTHKPIVSVNSRGCLDKSLIFLSKKHLIYAVGVSFQTALFSFILIWI